MAFAYSIALINHLIIGYKFPDGPLNNLTNHNMCKTKNISVLNSQSSVCTFPSHLDNGMW